MTRLPLDRRAVLQLSAGLAVTALAPTWITSASAQRKADAPIALDELMKPDALGDLVIGKADAPVTVIEYASMTCGHCAHFHNTVFEPLKAKYIDTGKVRFIMREFPLDNLALGASMLARCAGGDKTIPLIGILFSKQEEWAFVRTSPLPELFKIAKQAGFTQESFDKCLTDQALTDKILKGRERASKQFNVDATPTFFVNGKRLAGAPTLEEFDKAIDGAVKS